MLVVDVGERGVVVMFAVEAGDGTVVTVNTVSLSDVGALVGVESAGAGVAGIVEVAVVDGSVAVPGRRVGDGRPELGTTPGDGGTTVGKGDTGTDCEGAIVDVVVGLDPVGDGAVLGDGVGDRVAVTVGVGGIVDGTVVTAGRRERIRSSPTDWIESPVVVG